MQGQSVLPESVGLVSHGCKLTTVVEVSLQVKGLDPREAYRLFCVYSCKLIVGKVN